MSEEGAFRREFRGIGKIEKAIVDIAKGLAEAKISPQDLANPVSFQLAFSRLYEALLKAVEEGSSESYVAEVRFKDDLGNDIVFAVDLGGEAPAFASRVVRARIIVELYEEY